MTSLVLGALVSLVLGALAGFVVYLWLRAEIIAQTVKATRTQEAEARGGVAAQMNRAAPRLSPTTGVFVDRNVQWSRVPVERPPRKPLS